MTMIPVTLTTEDFEDLCDTAGYVIGHWADSATLGNDQYRINEEDDSHLITRSQLIHTIAEIIAGKYDVAYSLRRTVTSAIVNDDLGELDGYDIDAIIQLACFKEIVYG